MSDRRRSASAEPRVAVIVDSPSAAPDAGPGSPRLSRWARSTVSGWEIALWAFGLLLVIAAVQVNVSAIENQFTGSFGPSLTDDQSSMSAMIYGQSMMSLSPAAFSAGLISIALAIAIRALKSFGSINGAGAPAAQQNVAAATPVASAAPGSLAATPLTPPHVPSHSPSPSAANPVDVAPAAPAPRTFRPSGPTPAPEQSPAQSSAPSSAQSSAQSSAPYSAQVSANRLGELQPSAQPDRVTPVPVVQPARATSTGIRPATPTSSNPRRRAETDHSMFMRPAATPPRPVDDSGATNDGDS
jgi:hypothetical protein